VATVGTPASAQAASTAGDRSGKTLWTWTMSGRSVRSRAASSVRTEGFHGTSSGTATLPSRDRAAMSSLRRSNTSTRWPAARSSSTSWSTTLFSPLGCAEA
jgi:hypothetical protein